MKASFFPDEFRVIENQVGNLSRNGWLPVVFRHEISTYHFDAQYSCTTALYLRPLRQHLFFLIVSLISPVKGKRGKYPVRVDGVTGVFKK